MDASPLIERFLAAAGAATAPHELANQLEEALRKARAACPGIDLPDAAFAAHLGERVGNGSLLVMHVEDLYLALGCLQRDPTALKCFEDQVLGQVGQLVSRLRLATEELEDLKQQLRTDLLLGARGGPKLATYAGRGPLLGWVRVFAFRIALKQRARGRVSSEPEVLAQQPAFGFASDPESALIGRTHGALFLSALGRALDSLEPFDRLLLRQHHLDGVSIDDLAVFHARHRSQVFRQLQSARTRLFKQTRNILRSDYRLTVSECASVIRGARSRLDLALSDLFRPVQA
jgi:RNA polymerase sigma-70 factor (ECF subfamily)